MTARSRKLRAIAVAAAAALLVGLVGGTLTTIGPWYEALDKPSWQPPDWLFGPAWTIIFALTALSAAQAWVSTRTKGDREALIGMFCLNGFLNLLWSFLFFRLQRPDWALIEVGFLWLSILALILFVARFSRQASALLVPYLAWVSFAAFLNWTIVSLNAPFS